MLRIEASAEVLKPLIDLLVSGSYEPIVEFREDEIYALNMSPAETVLYEVRLPLPSQLFFVYEVENPPVYVQLDERDARRAIRKKKAKERVVITTERTERYVWVKLDGDIIGQVVEKPEKAPPSIETFLERLRPVNSADIDAKAFRSFLYNAEKAGCEKVAIIWDPLGPKIIAFDRAVARFTDFISWNVERESRHFYSVYLLLAMIPPSAISKVRPTTVRLRGCGEDNKPVFLELENAEPDLVEYRAVIAPIALTDDELKAFERLLKPRAVKIEAKTYAEIAEAFFDLLLARVDEPLIVFDRDKIKSKNMDPDHITLTEIEMEPVAGYTPPEEPVYCRVLADRSQIKAMLKTLGPEAEVRIAVSEDDKLLLNGNEIGHVEEDARLAPEVKVNFDGRIGLDAGITPKELSRLMSSMAKKGADAFGVALRPELSMLVFLDEDLFEEQIVVADVERAAVSGTRMDFARAIFPPSAVRLATKHGVPYSYVKISVRNFGPIKFEYEPWGGFTVRYYVAPALEICERIADRLGLLRDLTKEDVLEVFRAKAPEPLTEGQLEDLLRRKFLRIDKLRDILTQLIKEGLITDRTEGWVTYYSLTDREIPLKPLTKEAVLEAIRELCEALDTDAVGFLELQGYLGKEYQTESLYEILHQLQDEGLVESKLWPTRRRGGYAVDMKGYWALKPTEPEEAIEQAEEKPLKAPTEEDVLAAMERLHREVGAEVDYEAIRAALEDEGFDTTNLPELLDRLRDEGKIVIRSDGKIWTAEFLKQREEKPPPVPESYARVHFKRDMVRFIGMDRRYYGPFKACEEAVIEKPFADAFLRHGYVEVLGEGRSSSPRGHESEETEEGEKTWEEAKKEYMKWRVE